MRPLAPIGLWGSFLYFSIPAVVLGGIYFVLLPLMLDWGILPFYAHTWAAGVGMVPLFVASLVMLKREGYPVTWKSIKERFRFKPMTMKIWGWSLLLVALGAVVTFGVFAPIQSALIEARLVPIPSFIPDTLHPYYEGDPMQAYDRSVGGMIGNWWPFWVLMVVNAFSVITEEFWWRGIVLPRQEVALGNKAWVVHGLFWAPFHLFKYWAFIELFPICLVIAFMAQRFKNTTPALIIHFAINFLSGVVALAIVAADLVPAG